MNDIITLLQARMSSSRLPGKVLLPILGEPMLLRQIERVRQSKWYGSLMVVTSTHQEDQAIVQCCEQNQVAYHCGRLEDVLDRFYQAAIVYEPQHVVRLTGDRPLIDAGVIDQVIQAHIQGDFDYTTNALQPSYPDGLDVEVIRFSALSRAWQEAVLPSDREHVTPFIYHHPKDFRIGHVSCRMNLSHLRWTVDWPVDFELVQTVYDNLYVQNPNFVMDEILSLLEQHPELKTMITHYQRNEGMQRSMQCDQLFLRATNESEIL